MKRTLCLLFVIFHFFLCSAQTFTFVELNCENLFDTQHDEGKDDFEFTPEGERRWTLGRYWRKLNGIGKVILSCADDLPDIVALVEIENDSVMRDLTRRSLLSNAGYHYLMTESPDVRGIDVALLYLPSRFQPLCYETISVQPLKDMRPTRDLLYVQGLTNGGDTLHLFVVHAPSRWGGEVVTRPYRLQVAQHLCRALDALPPNAAVVVAGDFNDYAESPSLQRLAAHGLHNMTQHAVGSHGATGTYFFQGEWRSIDHILVSSPLVTRVDSAYINDAPFLLHRDENSGRQHPFRTFNGSYYQRGYSDHLPLVVRLRLGN